MIIKPYETGENMQIDMLGLPGSGKSTIAGEIKKAYRSLGVKANDYLTLCCTALPGFRAALLIKMPTRIRNKGLQIMFRSTDTIFKHCLLFISANRKLNEHVLCSLDRKDNGEEAIMVVRWLYELFAQHNLIHSTIASDNYIIYDEGFLNRLITLYGYEDGVINKELIGEYIESIPRPDLVFYVDTEIENCIKRMKKRGYPKRLKGKSERDIEMILRNCRECAEYAIDNLKETGVTVHRIDNNCNRKVSLAAIKAIINEQAGLLHITADQLEG